jgi:hypothetical protein
VITTTSARRGLLAREGARTRLGVVAQLDPPLPTDDGYGQLRKFLDLEAV